jgi:hypothetical protein
MARPQRPHQRSWDNTPVRIVTATPIVSTISAAMMPRKLPLLCVAFRIGCWHVGHTGERVERKPIASFLFGHHRPGARLEGGRVKLASSRQMHLSRGRETNIVATGAPSWQT